MVRQLSTIRERHVGGTALNDERVILRDGSTAHIRVAGPDDVDRLGAFFAGLSPESRRSRFFSVAPPKPDFVATLCRDNARDACLTLIVTRIRDGQSHIVATGSYLALDESTAEVAFAVDDSLHGKGLATVLLERLAQEARRQGFAHFWALTKADNRAMRDVFLESGFDVQEKAEGNEVVVDLAVLPSEAGQARIEERQRLATVAALGRFFRPESVAVVGASRDPESIGARVLQALIEGQFHGRIFPVNPKAAELRGLNAYPAVNALPETPTLAIIAVPAHAVLNVVDDCARRGVRAMIILSAGFAEVDGSGTDLQRQLLEKVRGHGISLIGPNCLGLLSTAPDVRLNATFLVGLPPQGAVAMSSDSGALGVALLSATEHYDLGISSFVSVGNRADISSNDLLEYWEQDEATKVILLYLESFGNPRRFARIVRRTSRQKPIVAVKAGRTGAGRRAAGSHTAALAASEQGVDALFGQTGVIRADTLQEMFEIGTALANQPLPKGRRVGIVTNAGGPGILCADACEAGGLELPQLSQKTRNQLAAFLPPTASLANPVDTIASAGADEFRKTVSTVLQSGEVDCLIVIYVSIGGPYVKAIPDAIALAVCSVRDSAARDIPVLACLMPDQNVHHLPIRDHDRIPCYAYPEAAARALSKAAAYASWRSQPASAVPRFADIDFQIIRSVCRKALHERGSGWLSTEETRRVLSLLQAPLAPGGVAATAELAVDIARRIGFPVAVKLASHELVHKTEIGCVHLNLPNEAAVRLAFNDIEDRLQRRNERKFMEGVLVERMIAGGAEVMIGKTHDPVFGPLVAFGLGGIHVEILGDVCFRVTPLTERDAAGMIRSIRGIKLLEGYRGHPPADLPALENLLLRISQLVEEIPEIDELDLNPVIALPPGQGCRIVDARVHVK
ncbi:MAG: GNAT family N-acetyltransferase [Planctomycetes bacterium]|nr:GNAT family N-acetyltransferase [Planctomycetota bacterium]